MIFSRNNWDDTSTPSTKITELTVSPNPKGQDYRIRTCYTPQALSIEDFLSSMEYPKNDAFFI
jgi:hypothetical protein